MIAHKKQFKIAGAIWLVIVMIICQIVPVFASSPLPTDDNGNWLPSSFYASWLIYNTSSQTYETVSVTSRITRDGLTFDFPFNSTGVSKITLLLYTGSASTYTSYYTDSFYISGFLTYTNNNGLFYVDLEPSSYLRSLYYSNETSSSPVVNLTSYFSDNPFIISSSDPFTFNRLSFVFDFPNAGTVSGTFSLTFSNFMLGGEDVKSRITVQNLDNASQDLTDLGEQLEVPKPTIQVSNIVEDALDGADYESVGSTTWSFMSNDLITKMLLITVSFALLGYILFGKKESGSK